MSQALSLSIVAAAVLGLIPLVPKMMRLRIGVLRFLRLRWFADMHEKYLDGIVIAVRVILVTVAVVLLATAFGWI